MKEDTGLCYGCKRAYEKEGNVDLKEWPKCFQDNVDKTV